MTVLVNQRQLQRLCLDSAVLVPTRSPSIHLPVRWKGKFVELGRNEHPIYANATKLLLGRTARAGNLSENGIPMWYDVLEDSGPSFVSPHGAPA